MLPRLCCCIHRNSGFEAVTNHFRLSLSMTSLHTIHAFWKLALVHRTAKFSSTSPLQRSVYSCWLYTCLFNTATAAAAADADAASE